MGRVTVPTGAGDDGAEQPALPRVGEGVRDEACVGGEVAPQIARLDAASAVTPPYPYYPHYRLPDFTRLDPPAA